MAAAELKFTKFDSTPWGFRLTGGKDYELPLTVVKVLGDSLAEKIGLTEGDTVVKINDSCTSQMTHEEAHDVITKAGNDFAMAVIRSQEQLIPNGHCSDHRTDPALCQDLPPIDQDICPIITEVPYPQIENETIDRTLTASPYFNPAKTYRPFSTEPIEGVPPVENPIILDPNYNDDFSHIKKLDFEPETIFKLERVNHKADNQLSAAGKLHLEETRNQIKDEVGNLDSALDLNAIEISAEEIVTESINKAVIVTEEIKKEIEVELMKSTIDEVAISNTETSEKRTDLSLNLSSVDQTFESLLNNQEFASPEEIQMWIMTAEYDSKIAEIIASRKASLKAEEIRISSIQENIVTIDNFLEIENKLKDVESLEVSTTRETILQENSETVVSSNENVDCSIEKSGIEANKISEIKDLSIIANSNIGESISSKLQESKLESVKDENSEQSITSSDVLKKADILSKDEVSIQKETTELTEQSLVAKLELNSQSLEAKQLTELLDKVQANHEKNNFVSTSVQEVANVDSEYIVGNNSKEIKKENIHKLRSDYEESHSSLQEAKRQTMLAANTITEETKLSTIHRQIPTIAPIPSQHYTDQLLKTFFVHLTDVMIALSRMIIAESGTTYGSRSVSPMPPLKRDTQNVEVVEQVITQTRKSQAKSTNQSSTSSQRNSINQTESEVCGRIVGSTEEVEKLVESVEQTRKLAESVQQARKLSITAEQSQMLAESAEQLRRLSLTAEQTIKEDLSRGSEDALEKLSNELTHVSDMVNSKEVALLNSQESNLQNDTKDALELLLDNVSSVEQTESNNTQSLEISEQKVKMVEDNIKVIQQSIESYKEEHVKSFSSEIVSTTEQYKAESSTEIVSSAKEDLLVETIEKSSERVALEPLDISNNEKVLQRTDSGSSGSTTAMDPPTPLTDEYIFRLDIHVKGLRSRTSSPDRPKPAQETPPEHAPRKPKLTASITSEIETPDVATNPAADTNNESIIERDDLRKEGDRAIGIPAADAITPQLPGELVAEIKSDESNQTVANEAVLATGTVESTLAAERRESIKKITLNEEHLAIEGRIEKEAVESQQVEEMELAGFRRVEFVVESGKELVEKQEVIEATTNGKDEDEKPGMTDDDIAVLISGEAEVLKDAHVLGLQRVIASHMNRVKDDDEEDDPNRVNFKKILPQCSFIKESEVFKALNEEAVKTKEEKKKEDRKWTTFLQTPDRPVPRRKGMFYEPPPVEKYQVKIVKQAKPRVAPDFPKSFETGLLPWEERLLNQPTPPPVEQEPPILIPEESPEYLEALDNLPESAVPDLEDTGIELPPEPQVIEDQDSQEDLSANQADVEDNQGGDTDSCLDQTTESNLEILENMVTEADPNLTVEEQLAQVQAQLLALSQLPAAIQQTLEIVTQQLSKIVPQKAAKQVEEIPQTTDDQTTDVDQGITTDEERLEDVPQEIIAEEAGNEAQDEPVVEQTLVPEVDPEELERIRKVEEEIHLEQRKIDKQKKDLMAELQLEHHQRQVKQRAAPRVTSPKPAFGPLAPSQRPIFLPGGRKWRNPKDAYNDAFIAETLTKQAEIIQGKTLGVNFMKYEKPPISLDHLKDSDVYKMVHDMDTKPLRAIEKVSTIPITEEEFREKCRSVTPTTALERQEVFEEHSVLPEQVQP